MSELLPSGWKKRALGDVLGRRAERADGSEPLLSVTQKRGVIPQDEVGRRDSSSEYKGNYWRVFPGDIVYNTMRMWQGVSGVSGQHGIVSPAYTVCKPAADVDSKFLAYLLKKPSVVNKFYRMSQGLVSDTWNLRYAEFSRIPVSLPPLGEQRRIAEILDALDARVDASQKYLARLKVLCGGMFDDLLPWLPGSDTPDGWSLATFRELTTAPICYGIVQAGAHVDDGVPVVMIKDMKSGLRDELHRTHPSIDASYARSRVRGGDVLVSIKGTIGRTAIVPDNFKGNISRDVARIRVNGRIEPKFLTWLLRTRGGQEILSNSIVGTTRAEVSIGILKRLKVPVPPLAEQRKILEIVSAVEDRIDLEDSIIHKLKKVKQGLAEDLLTGRVRVPEAEAVVESL